MAKRSCSIEMDGEKVTFNPAGGISLVEAWGYINKIFLQDAIKDIPVPVQNNDSKSLDGLQAPSED